MVVGVLEHRPPHTHTHTRPGLLTLQACKALVTPGTVCVMEAEARAGALGGREEAFIMMIRAEIG